MAVYAELFDGTRLEFPDGTDPSVIAATAKRITQSISAGDIKPPAPEPTSAGFSASDLGVAFGQGAIGSTKALTDVAGATNVASQSLDEIQKELSKSYSPERQAEMQRQAARMKAAEESGSKLAEIKAAASNILESPLQSTAQAIGSFVPYLPAMFAAPVAATLGLGARSVAAITSVAQQAPKVMATAQGAGAVKGAIYDGVYDAEIAAGVSPELAKKKAEGAQEYFGSNFDQIALGTGIGYFTGSTGIEKLITPAGRAAVSKNIGRRVGTTAVAEAIPEGIQEGQERLAQNLALQREGYDVDALTGVAGGATQGALMGALASGPIAAVLPPGVGPAVAPTVDPTAPTAPPEEVDAPPVDVAAPRPVPPSEAQDTQAMIDEFRGMGLPAAEAEVAAPVAAAAPEIAQEITPLQPEAAQPEAVKPAFQEKFEQKKEIEAELKELYKERNKLSRVGDNLIPFLKKYGVKPNAKADMGIEKGDRRLPVGVFKKSGYGLDELAMAAVNDGIITEQDLARQPDEVEAFRELVYDALQGNVSQTPFNLENMAKLNAIESRIEQLERPEQPESFDLQAETAQETEARLTQEAEQKKLEDDKFIQDEMAAQAERDRAEIARQSVQQAKNFALGQTPQESLTGQERLDDDIPFARSRVASPEEIDLAEKVANVYRDDGRDSSVVYQKDDIALIQTRKKNGDVIYMPIKGQRHSTNYVDVSTDKGSQLMTALNLTQAQKDDLVKAREEIELSEKEKHEKTPFLVIKPGVTGSPGIPKEFVNVAKGFVKMLGITGNIYMISKTEAAANKDNFTGPHRPIGYMGDKVEFGSVRKLDDDNFVMLVNPGTSKVRTIETIAHELGHIHEIQVFDNANPEVQKAIIKDFNKWFDSQKNMSAKELVDTLRPKVTAQQTEIVNPMARATDLDAYWRNFPEWYADQVSRWATTSDKPLTVVDKFFKKLADALKKFYKTLKGQKYLPTQSMKEFLDNIAAQSQFDSIKETFDKGQMALFSKSKVEPTKKQDADEITESKGKVEAPTAAEEKPTAQARNYLGQPIEATWAFPEDRFIKIPGLPEQSVDKLLYILQDKQIDLKRAQEGIAKAAGEITDNINAYDKEQLFHGKVATGIRNFLLNELMPAVKKIKEFKLTTKDMQDYLLARHAEERNDRMNELNKLDPRTGEPRKTPWELQDRASGMSTADARKYLADLDPAKKKSLETIGETFDKMVTGTQKILVDSGSESAGTIEAWNEAYDHYMPLFRVEEDFNNGSENKSGLSRGFNVSSPFSKRAMGSAKEVQNIVTNLIKQRERALIRAEKMTVIKALYGLFLMNPNPDIALPVNPDAIKDRGALIAELESLGYDRAAEIADNLMAEPKTRFISKGKRVIDKDTGLPTSDTEESVRLRIDNNARFGDNVLSFRVDGKNRYLFFRQDNPNAVRMAASLNSLDVESLGTALSIVAKGTRWFANVNTQYNPIFAAVNLIRDVGAAQVNLTTTPLAGKQAQVTAGIFPAMRGIFKVLRAERNREVGGDSAMEKAFREFREQGGQTGYRDSITRKESDLSIIDDLLKQKSLSGNAFQAMKSVFGALSDFNDTLENSIRLSAYIQASKPKSEGGLGLSKQQAAVIAKNLTVNFDKKGQISANVNALYAFFNASVQGTARLATTLTGPKGKAIIGGGMLLGTMQSVLLAAAGFRDDEPPEFVKQRNFVIPTPDGNYITIPYPLGFNLLPNIGRITTEFMISGGKDPAKRASDMLGSVADAFSPIGSSGLSMQTITPTVLDPLAALESNKDAFGRPIYKEDRATNPTPGYMRSRENASEMSKGISYFLNLASGGGKYSKGLLSPTADEIDYVIGQVTGGLGREIMKTGQTIKAAGTGEDLPAYRVPLLGRFYGETESNAAEAQRFYNNVTKMADHENEIKGRIKNKESVASYYRDNPEARLYQQANTIENQINALNKQKKEFIERDLPKDRIKRIENQKALIMKRFNDRLAKFEE